MPFIFWICLAGLITVIGLFVGMELARPYPSDIRRKKKEAERLAAEKEYRDAAVNRRIEARESAEKNTDGDN